MLNSKMIGNKIAKGRKKLNISQAQLAEQLFISSQAVGKWERGESMPDITTFNRLAEILGVDLNYFSENFNAAATEITPVAPLQSGESASEKQKKKTGWDMSRANWVDADFSGLKNLHEKFSSSNMQRCKFIGSDLSGLMLKTNNIDGCDFSNSKINNSSIHRSSVINNTFKDCSLQETSFSESNMQDCDFSGANLSEAEINSGVFAKNALANAVFNRTSFNGTEIKDLVFEGMLEDCSFENCYFKKVTFQRATLINCFFKNNSNVKRIRFIDCQADRITYEFLKIGKADLNGVTLLST